MRFKRVQKVMKKSGVEGLRRQLWRMFFLFPLSAEAVPIIENLKDPKVIALVNNGFIVEGRVKLPRDAPGEQQNHRQFEVSLMVVVSQNPPPPAPTILTQEKRFEKIVF